MFTGLVEADGVIEQRQSRGGDARLRIRSSTLDFADVKLGDSIATNGVCLTVVEFGTDYFSADVSNETLALSTLANLAIGTRVNLEKAMLPTTRFGGHMVSGHVDGTAKIIEINRDGRAWDYHLSLPMELARYVAHKGSICVDGVSLTVNDVSEQQCRLTIVPHTAEKTQIANYQVGDLVNIEVDMIARYLERLLLSPKEQNRSSGVTLDSLRHAGFIKN
ncbi:riboflavin synthase [Umboniibacter marinipuniceus]|uniref:Riboflavin synthase n=1 Tax=Umboniibacter marinipuniceus TaxID=569599 RepID=A0A3M0ATY6_9GAMM|nr:riboflavin synthase [Umboniibacter marinipuniceus]RMA82402.1 riboflavin synthase alpha chain [Umboniibacter marinipuniceus]